MLTLNYSGWSKGYGPYKFNIPFDDTKTNWEIHFSDGKVSRQETPFHIETRDWNCDRDVYSQYGAWFFLEESSRGEFYTPERMLRLVVDGDATVPGLPDPSAPIKAYKEEQQRKAAEAELAMRARSVSIKDKSGQQINVLFDIEENSYRIRLSDGKRFFQTGYFELQPERFVDRGDSFRPVFGAWFQSDSEVLEAIYFTPEEIVQMVFNENAVIEGGIPLSQTQEQTHADSSEHGCKKRSREAER